MSPEFETLAREIAHYEPDVSLSEAREVMQYIENSKFPRHAILPAMSVGGWATAYYGAWVFNTFPPELMRGFTGFEVFG